MLEQQLVHQEHLQTENERLAKQVSSLSSDQRSSVSSSSHTARNLLTEDKNSAHILVVRCADCFGVINLPETTEWTYVDVMWWNS